MQFKDKVCLVTGGTSGIGKATCIRFGQEGGKVVVLGRNEEEGQEVVETITSGGGEAMFIRADVSETDQIEEAVRKTVERWGKIDVLVNNAAQMKHKSLAELSEADWDQVMAVNLKAVFLFCKLCVPHMQRGAIVNVSSVHAHQTTVNALAYATSKAGMEAFTRAMVQECKISKVRVNCVAPGAVDTPMLWENPNVKSGVEKIKEPVGKPEELAAVICFLASAEASYINGTTLVVDGGELASL
jgi:glucose 1-dehydrogenase